MYLRLVAAVLSLSTLATACTTRPSPSAASIFQSQLEADWKYWMVQYPETATAIGYRGQNDRWTDYSRAAIDARAAYLKKSLDDLSAVDRARLPAPDRVSYDLYRGLLDTAVKGLEFHFDAIPLRGVIPHNLLMPTSQLEGVQQDIPRTFTLMPHETREDYENIVLRLERIGTLVDQTIALMEQGLAAGMTPPKIALRGVPDQARAHIVRDPLESPLLSAFMDWPNAVPEADRAALTKRATDAYQRVVAPAFGKLHDFLATRYVPACRETVGTSALPSGAAMYAYEIRWHTTVDRTPDEIHQLGVAEVARIRREMDRVIAASGFKGGYDDFVKFLRTDRRFYFADADSLLTAYRDIAKRADPELAHLFGRLPQTPYGVQPIPDAIAPSQTTAYYEPGSLVAGRPGNMFANTYKLDARPKWEMEALTMHEAVPGHHVQISIAQEQAGLPEFRKHSSYTAFVEGWGLYAESLGDEMEFYKDPYSKFGQLTYEMWRAVRLVVDTGLHAMGWTRERAIEFFRANAAKTEQDIVVEIDRYLVYPGQALGYKMGQLKIRELRTRAARDLGARFDVRTFHDVVLDQGAVPLDLLERQVAAWIAKPSIER